MPTGPHAGSIAFLGSAKVPNHTPQERFDTGYRSNSKLELEKRYFQDKCEIKPWLMDQLAPRGISVVIERSDDTKVVFKCKHVGASNVSKVMKPKKLKTSCPFRIRANYSLRAKKWSLVIVDDRHNHPLYPPTKLPTPPQMPIPMAIPPSADHSRTNVLSPSFVDYPTIPRSHLMLPSIPQHTISQHIGSTVPVQQPIPQQQMPQQQIQQHQHTMPSQAPQAQAGPQQPQPAHPSQTTPAPRQANSAIPSPVLTQQNLAENSPQSAPELASRTSHTSLTSSTNSLPDASLARTSSQNTMPSPPQLTTAPALPDHQESSELDVFVQQKLNKLHLEINNLLLQLNVSPSLSDVDKENTYTKAIQLLQDSLRGTHTPLNLNGGIVRAYGCMNRIVLPALNNNMHTGNGATLGEL